MRAVIRNRNDLFRFAEEVDAKLDGKPYTIEVKRFYRGRTLDQNAKCHAMIRGLAQHTGYTEHEMKDTVKALYCPLVTRKVGQKTVAMPKGTSELTVVEMADFVEHLYQLGAEVGCRFTEVA